MKALSEPTSQPEPPADAPAPSRIREAITGIPKSMLAHWKRSLAAAFTLLALISGLAVAWTYIASLAIESERENLALAFKSLDEGDYEQARSLVRQVLNSGALPSHEHGGPLFVLGAVKTHDAASDVVSERRRTDYLVASRYLSEARSYGFAPKREKQGLLLLGKSLVESCQTEEGIEVLSDALGIEPRETGEIEIAIHRVLADAYMLLPHPDFERALTHAETALEGDRLTPDQQVAALLLKTKIVARLGRFDEAKRVLASIPVDAQQQPSVLSMHGKVLLDSVEEALERLPVQDHAGLPPELAAEVDQAAEMLREAQSLDRQATDVTRRSTYLLGRASELRGETGEARKFYARTVQQYRETSEGLAAALADADLLHRAGEDQRAVDAYCLVLESDVNPTTYRSDVLPMEQLRQRILKAVGRFVEGRQFEHALKMLDHFRPLFAKSEELQIRGETLRRWADGQLQQAAGEGVRANELVHAGFKRLREAGVAFERLAELHYATRYYTDDLWNSADCYFLGHSYSNAARRLDDYLKHEPENRNAEALLRLGQAELALGHVDACITALEECVELYGRENASYQARIDCAKAYWHRGDAASAERLLRINLTASSLKPRSPEWKDTLFALGSLLFEQDKHEEAISTLEEAVERYPDDRQALQSRYLVGEAYRRWALEPLQQLQQARTASDRDKNQQLVDERLTKALEYFKAVQSSITLRVTNVQADPIYAAMRRNCYMLEGAVLFDLGRYNEAIEAYQNVSSLYPNEPFVLETFVQIANCWQRLDRAENSRGAIAQAQLTLEHIPSEADFLGTTAFNREEWRLLLSNMRQW